MDIKNIFEDFPFNREQEIFEEILRNSKFKLERIVSFGQATPENEWYDQPRDEWVILLSGSAALRFESDQEEIQLKQGDYVFIPAHQKHRVSRTTQDQPTVWLALHF